MVVEFYIVFEVVGFKKDLINLQKKVNSPEHLISVYCIMNKGCVNR